jgi:RimJ/RimL family protein N-acetyltransferase
VTHPLWPLYDLRVRTARLELHLPTEGEIASLAAIARAGIHGDDEMPFPVPWSTLPSPDFEWGFVRHHWLARGSWVPSDWVLEMGVFVDAGPVGMQAVFATSFSRLRTVRSGSWLGRASQGLGIGREMRIAMLTLAFDGLGAEVAETEAFADNAASIGVSRSVGYEENGVGRLASDGGPRDMIRFRMTRARWQEVRAERGFPDVAIDGLEPCLPLLGVG